MKGLVYLSLIFVVLAVVINVAVAWAYALLVTGSGQGLTGATGASVDLQQWYVANKPWSKGKSFAGILEESNPEFINSGWRQQRLWEPSMDIPKSNMPIGLWRRSKVASVFRTYSGWPMYCLYGEHWTRYIDGGERCEIIYKYASALSVEKGMVPQDSARIIPLRPIWLGFAVNTMFFGGILWLLLCGPIVVRRVIRRRSCRCAGCGYPIGTSAVCSECGNDLKTAR